MSEPTFCGACGVIHRVGYDNTLCPATLTAPAPLTDEELARWLDDQRAVVQPDLGTLRLLATVTAALSRAEQAERERGALIAAIRDIDAHATPYGMANDGTDNPQAYLVTVGALHRALGAAEGRATAAPCPCRLTSPERLREIANEIEIRLPYKDTHSVRRYANEQAVLAILTAQLTDKKEGA